MWWKCEKGNYVNMRHMATLIIEKVEDKWHVCACEVAEQAKYLIKMYDTLEQAEKLAGDIIRAEK